MRACSWVELQWWTKSLVDGFYAEECKEVTFHTVKDLWYESAPEKRIGEVFQVAREFKGHPDELSSLFGKKIDACVGHPVA